MYINIDPEEMEMDTLHFISSIFELQYSQGIPNLVTTLLTKIFFVNET